MLVNKLGSTMAKKIKNLIGFLTIIPVGMDPNQLTDTAETMFMFPLIGALIGFLGGGFAWLLRGIISNTVGGILTLGLILFLTGLHHTDGLLDFGDGLMYPGSAEKKIEIMHDPRSGTGGVTLGVIVIFATAFSIAQLNPQLLISGLIVSEVSAKLSMVVMAWGARSGYEGMNTPFVDIMHDHHRNTRLLAALFLAFVIATSLLNIAGITAVLSSLGVTLVLLWVSKRHFRGVTGDVFGAGNELTRLVSLVFISSVAL